VTYVFGKPGELSQDLRMFSISRNFPEKNHLLLHISVVSSQISFAVTSAPFFSQFFRAKFPELFGVPFSYSRINLNPENSYSLPSFS